jgi:hypothetical protein
MLAVDWSCLHVVSNWSPHVAGTLVNANDFEVVVPSDFVDLGVPAPKKKLGAVTAGGALTVFFISTTEPMGCCGPRLHTEALPPAVWRMCPAVVGTADVPCCIFNSAVRLYSECARAFTGPGAPPPPSPVKARWASRDGQRTVTVVVKEASSIKPTFVQVCYFAALQSGSARALPAAKSHTLFQSLLVATELLQLCKQG